MAKNLPNNNSIWVYDNESLSKLESLKINFDVITNAHFSANEKNHFINFTFPKKLRQIRTITLKSFYISI